METFLSTMKKVEYLMECFLCIVDISVLNKSYITFTEILLLTILAKDFVNKRENILLNIYNLVFSFA